MTNPMHWVNARWLTPYAFSCLLLCMAACFTKEWMYASYSELVEKHPETVRVFPDSGPPFVLKSLVIHGDSLVGIGPQGPVSLWWGDIDHVEVKAWTPAIME